MEKNNGDKFTKGCSKSNKSLLSYTFVSHWMYPAARQDSLVRTALPRYPGGMEERRGILPSNVRQCSSLQCPPSNPSLANTARVFSEIQAGHYTWETR